jgi:ankyrin repeat protein
VRLVLEKGVDIETRDKDGWAALHRAAIYGHEVVTRLLLDNGTTASFPSPNSSSSDSSSTRISAQCSGVSSSSPEAVNEALPTPPPTFERFTNLDVAPPQALISASKT